METIIAAALSATVAGIFALLGVGLAQRHAATEATRQEKQQRYAWQRDDAARSYEHRREAYPAYLHEWRRHADMAIAYHSRGHDGPEPDHDWIDELYETFTAVQMFGTDDAVAAAEVAMRAVNNYAMGPGKPFLDGDAIEPFRRAARLDLGIPSEPVRVRG